MGKAGQALGSSLIFQWLFTPASEGRSEVYSINERAPPTYGCKAIPEGQKVNPHHFAPLGQS